MAYQQNLDDCRKVFGEIDTDKSGSISEKELKIAFEKMGFELSKSEVSLFCVQSRHKSVSLTLHQ